MFELVNQLQYHTHQENGIEICMDFARHLYLWQGLFEAPHDLAISLADQEDNYAKWQSVSNDSQEHLERFYCNPENDRMRMKYGYVFITT